MCVERRHESRVEPFTIARPYSYQVPHLELAEDIARAAGPGHPRWGWALQARMDTLLIHLLGAAHALPEPGQSVEADWHPDACVALGADEDALAAVTLLVTAQA